MLLAAGWLPGWHRVAAPLPLRVHRFLRGRQETEAASAARLLRRCRTARGAAQGGSAFAWSGGGGGAAATRAGRSAGGDGGGTGQDGGSTGGPGGVGGAPLSFWPLPLGFGGGEELVLELRGDPAGIVADTQVGWGCLCVCVWLPVCVRVPVCGWGWAWRLDRRCLLVPGAPHTRMRIAWVGWGGVNQSAAAAPAVPPMPGGFGCGTAP